MRTIATATRKAQAGFSAARCAVAAWGQKTTLGGRKSQDARALHPVCSEQPAGVPFSGHQHAQHRSSCVRTRTQEGVCAKPSSPPAVQRLQVGCWFGVSVAPGRINQSLAPPISGTDGGQVQKVQRYNPKGCCTYLYLFLAWVQKVQKRLVPICTYLYPAHLTAPAAQTIPAASWMAAAVTSAFMAR